METAVKKLQNIISILGIILLNGALAQAAPITIAIAGEVTYLNLGTALGDSVHVGDSFTGTYTYDSIASDSDSSVNRGVYQYNSPYGINIALGGCEFKTDSAQMSGQFSISISDNYLVNADPVDMYSVNSYKNAALSNGRVVSYVGWELNDWTYTALSSTALPTTIPVLNQWNYNSMHIKLVGDYGGSLHILGTVTHAEIIPEPATMLLLGAGGLLLRRKK